MEAKIKMDMNYYEFLNVLQDVSINSKTIQKNCIRCIYENYDISQVKNKLNKKIAKLDRLLIK